MNSIPKSVIAGLLGHIQKDSQNKKAYLLQTLNFGISEDIVPEPYKSLYSIQRLLFEGGEDHTRFSIQKFATNYAVLNDVNIQELLEEVIRSSVAIGFEDALARSQEVQVRHDLMSLAQEVVDGSKSQDLMGAIDGLSDKFLRSIKLGERVETVDNRDVVAKCRERWEQAKLGTGMDIKFPIPNLNNLYSNISAGMHVVGARPKVGKTSFCVYCAKEMAKMGEKIGLMSLEMQSERLVERMSASEINGSTQPLAMGVASDRKFQQGMDALSVIEELPLYWSENRMTLSDIRKWISVRQAKDGVRLFILDHMGKIAPDKKYDGGYARMTDYSNELSAMAIQMNVVLMVICHIKRVNGARPTMDDLRDTGHIEQDAESILLLSELPDEDRLSNGYGNDPTMKYVVADMVGNRNGGEDDFIMEYNMKGQTWTQV